MIYDVIIVGAGPAGSTAACLLVKNNLSVLLLDQHTFPRYKPCGGGLPLHTLSEIPFDVKPVLEFTATSGKITYQGQPAIDARFYMDYAWLADRTKLDAFLLQKAIEAGVVHLGSRRVTGLTETPEGVQVTAGEEQFSSRWLIGADGVNSITARALGLLSQRRTGAALEAELAVPAERLREFGKSVIFDFGALPGGYGWVFAKRDHFSVGVFQADPRKNTHLREQLDQFIACQSVLKDPRVMHLQGHRIPLGGGNSPLHTQRCLLAGDAANLADPWLGEGVYYAVRSASLASQHLLTAHRQAEADESWDLSDYTDHIQKEIRDDFHYAQKIARLVYALPRQATSLLQHTPAAQEIIFSKIRGDFSFHETWHRLLINSPKFAFQALGGKLSPKSDSYERNLSR